MKNVWKREEGALIVEASYVFPIMVLVIFMLIYAGNTYLLKCQVEEIVTEEVIKGAAYCGDPVTYQIEKNGGSVPSYSAIKVEPYRFVFGAVLESDYETIVYNNINKRMKEMGSGLFSNMALSSIRINGPDFDSKLIYATFSAEVEYKIALPIRIWGEEPIILDFHCVIDVPVADSVELIRNIDMIEDYLLRSKKVNEGLDKIKELANKVSEWK